MLAGCVVRLCYVDLVDLVPSIPLEVAFTLRAMKEILWFCAFAFLVYYWVEVQNTMRLRLKNVEVERCTMLCAVAAFASIRMAQVVAESLRADTVVAVAKAACKC